MVTTATAAALMIDQNTDSNGFISLPSIFLYSMLQKYCDLLRNKLFLNHIFYIQVNDLQNVDQDHRGLSLYLPIHDHFLFLLLLLYAMQEQLRRNHHVRQSVSLYRQFVLSICYVFSFLSRHYPPLEYYDPEYQEHQHY